MYCRETLLKYLQSSNKSKIIVDWSSFFVFFSAFMDKTVWERENISENCWSDFIQEANVVSSSGTKDEIYVLDLLFRKVYKSSEYIT